MMRRVTAILFATCLLTSAFAQGSDCWLQQMSQNNDLFSLAQLLQSTQVLPNSVQEKSTLFLPTNAAFVAFLVNNNLSLDTLSQQLAADPQFRGRIDSVLMEHVLMLPNVNLADLANSPTPTALSMIHDGDYDVTVSNDLSTVSSPANQANIVDTVTLCGMTGFIIDAVLLPASDIASVPVTTHDQIEALFAAAGNSTMV